MGTLEQLTSIACALFAEPCRVIVLDRYHGARAGRPDGTCRVEFAGGAFGQSQPSVRDLALLWRKRLQEGRGEIASDERAHLVARLDAWLGEARS